MPSKNQPTRLTETERGRVVSLKTNETSVGESAAMPCSANACSGSSTTTENGLVAVSVAVPRNNSSKLGTIPPQPWRLSHRASPEALPVADRHYNRQKPGTPQFVPPGRCIVLTHGDPVSALWVTSWPFAQYVKHGWPGAWINSCFRKECDGEASAFIRQAVAATLAQAAVEESWEGGRVPALGMVTFIDPAEVTPRKIRGRSTWGHSYFEAGFVHVGYTKAGLWAFQLTPDKFPAASEPVGFQGHLPRPSPLRAIVAPAQAQKGGAA